jgi:hypothetical protein
MTKHELNQLLKNIDDDEEVLIQIKDSHLTITDECRVKNCEGYRKLILIPLMYTSAPSGNNVIA